MAETSFPFLAIAKHFRRDYCEVIRLAEFIETHGTYDAIFDRALYCAVEDAVINEHDRRARAFRFDAIRKAERERKG